MSEKQFTGSIALSKLVHVIMEKKGKSGMVKGIFIPIEANKLVEGKEGSGAVYMNIQGKLKDEEDNYGNHGFISYRPNMGKKWSDLSQEEQEAIKKLSPILGSIKVWGNDGQSANDNSGAASDSTLSDEDDLPF